MENDHKLKKKLLYRNKIIYIFLRAIICIININLNCFYDNILKKKKKLNKTTYINLQEQETHIIMTMMKQEEVDHLTVTQ